MCQHLLVNFYWSLVIEFHASISVLFCFVLIYVFDKVTHQNAGHNTRLSDWILCRVFPANLFSREKFTLSGHARACSIFFLIPGGGGSPIIRFIIESNEKKMTQRNVSLWTSSLHSLSLSLRSVSPSLCLSAGKLKAAPEWMTRDIIQACCGHEEAF